MENNAWIAVDRSVTFRRTDGLIQSALLEIPRQRSGVRYTLVAANFDCGTSQRIVVARTEFSSRQDPTTTTFDPPIITNAVTSSAIAEQVRVVCGSTARVGSLSLQDLVRQAR